MFVRSVQIGGQPPRRAGLTRATRMRKLHNLTPSEMTHIQDLLRYDISHQYTMEDGWHWRASLHLYKDRHGASRRMRCIGKFPEYEDVAKFVHRDLYRRRRRRPTSRV